MWSRSRSALVPSSVTTCPLTETAPPMISFSAARREAIPAAAMIFCRRSEDIMGKDYQTGRSALVCITLSLLLLPFVFQSHVAAEPDWHNVSQHKSDAGFERMRDSA